MDNNKKQNYSGAGNSKTSNQPTDSSRQKSTSSDIQTSKHWPKRSRRRENPSSSTRYNNNNTKQQIPAKARPNVDKKPRVRGHNSHNYGTSYCGANEDHFASRPGLGLEHTTFYDCSSGAERFVHTDYELNSVYSPGNKKQNLNHLLNFYYAPREVDYYDGVGNNGNNQRNSYTKKHKYNKEQFLQANFQFVIKASARSKTDGSADTLIDWSLIEQINFQTADEPQCPICLYPPVAAKVTRCGHVYCWPCILHYLSLSDKAWRKCPICYDAIHSGDLKSASIVQQQAFNVSSDITLRLMRRKRDSLFIEKYDNIKNDQSMEKYPYVSSPIEEKLFSKFILATRNDVADILAREQKELLTDVDESCPEYIFIQQALELLKQRIEKLGEIEQKDVEKINVEEKAQGYINSTINVVEQTEQLLHSDGTKIVNELDFKEVVSESSSNTEIVASTSSSSTKQSLNKFYYFYQSDDGQNIYLHPLNVKMLQACYGSLAEAPSVIKALIIQKEQHSMDEDHRRKFTCLGHLPLTCQFAVVEIKLQPPYVTEGIINAFKNDILFRKKERQRRDIEERKREKQIDAINDRKMGKIIASTANINITSSEEFPTCGFEESLTSSLDVDVTDNVPSTSKGCRTKTVSTSSAGSCSYSAIALHCKKEQHTSWSTATKQSSVDSTIAKKSATDDGETSILNTIHTNLGDVLAQALSQKDRNSMKMNDANNNNNSSKGNGNKKTKKNKKILPLYSTGMKFNGN